VFEEDVDNLTNADLITLRFKLSSSSVQVIKAINASSNEERGIENGGILPSGYWIGATLGISNYGFQNYGVGFSGSSVFLPQNVVTLKSNSEHNFGLVYEDGRLRRSFVQPIDAVTIPALTDNKSSSVIFRVNHTPPDWATKWKIVYAGNDKYSYYEQYSVAEAFSGNSGGYEFDALYISMRHLEGKPNSFKDSKYPNIDYEFAKGDRLRILRYKQDSGGGNKGYVSPKGYEFDIADYKYFDESDTPIVPYGTETDYRSTGWFLVLRNKDYDGFSAADIVAQTDFWREDVIVEIYRPKKQTEELIYRETGYDFPISTYNETRYHVGVQRDLGIESVIRTDITVIPTTIFGTTIYIGQSNSELFVGDKLSFTTPSASVLWTVASVEMMSDGTAYYVTFVNTGSYNEVTTETYAATVTNTTTIVRFTGGDSYLRPRIMKVNPTTDTSDADFVKQTQYESQIVESMALNDFIKSNYYSLGKPNVVNKDAKIYHRKSSITYSDAYAIDNPINTLSSFNNSLANWVDYPINYGGIRYMFDDGEAMTVLQQRKVFVIPVGRNIIEYTDGSANATISRNVISDKPQYLLGDFGVNDNIESVAKDVNGRKFFVDGLQRKVCMINGGRIDVISDIDMEGFFDDMFSSFSARQANYKIYGVCNNENSEYIVSRQDVVSGVFKVYLTPFIELPENADYTYTVQIDNSDLFTLDYTENDSYIPNIEDEDRTFGEICEEFGEDVGWLYVDKLEIQPYVYFSAGSTSGKTTMPIIITTSDRLFYVRATYTFSSKTIVPEDPATCDYDYATTTAESEELGITVAFDYSQNYWTTRYSFIPEGMAFTNDTLFSFKDGFIYKHVEAATPCEYYGVQYNMKIDVVSNYDPSKNKFYKALSVEGTDGGDVVVTTKTQNTTVDVSLWQEIEDELFTFLPRDESATSWSNYLFIGTLNSVTTLWLLEFGLWQDSLTWIDTKTWVDTPVAGSGTSALVFDNAINMIPIPKGADISYVPATAFTASQADPDTNVSYTLIPTNMTTGNILNKRSLAFGGTNVLSAGDMVYVKKASGVDGDYMRGFWCKFAFTITPTANTEIYAINAIYQTSRLHNELGESDRKDVVE